LNITHSHPHTSISSIFFFNDPPPTEIYTLSLHDALPISASPSRPRRRPSVLRAARPCSPIPSRAASAAPPPSARSSTPPRGTERSEEHTSELQSRGHLVCRLLLEKKKKSKVSKKKRDKK